MEYKRLGNTKIEIAELGIGTWKLGADREAAYRSIRAGIDHGMRFVDTAEMYQNEDIVGNAIRGHDVFLATKVSPHHFHYDDVIKACKESIKRLKVKKIDLYQLHWPNHRVDIGETMKAMEKLCSEGLIDNIGVSNFSVEELVEAQAAMSHNAIVSNQVEYSIMSRRIEHDGLLEFCKKEHVTIIAYSPLARGEVFDRTSLVGRIVEEMAKAYKKTVAQVALNYLIRQDGVVAIPKAENEAHIVEDAGASGWKLKDEDVAKIRKAVGDKDVRLAGDVAQKILKSTGAWAAIMERLERARIRK